MIAFFANIFGYVLNFIYEIVKNYGLAIIIFSILIKVLMIPLSIKQQKTMKKSTKIQKKLKEIQFKYKNNPEMLNQATMEVYKSENMSPFSGCLSAIVQIILLFAVFYLVRSPLTYMEKVNPDIINKYSKIVKENNPHLILLDINLPVFDGYFICREIRKTSEVPIIVVTSRDSEVDELMSMNLGADDFVTKPYNTQILLARIAALLKRSGMNSNSNSILTYKDFKLNLSNATVIYNDKNIELTKNEVKILSYLINHKGEIVSRELLMEHLWNSDFFVDDSTLTVNITRLRKKLDEIGIKNVIETRRGLGYIMR